MQFQSQREQPPSLDSHEALLVTCFLRRHVTYCARQRRFTAMQGVTALLDEIRQVKYEDPPEQPEHVAAEVAHIEQTRGRLLTWPACRRYEPDHAFCVVLPA
jgi:hypothetical protein